MSPDDPHRVRTGLAEAAEQRRRALRVVITDAMGRPLRKRALGRWLEATAPARARGVLTLALVSDADMRRLNQRFAHVDHATDVLSFPSHGFPRLYLGDIVIATGAASRQARNAGHSVETELRVLALHGLLHLLGYDHASDDGQMARLERRLRRNGGLREGLIDRAGGVGHRDRSKR